MAPDARHQELLAAARRLAANRNTNRHYWRHTHPTLNGHPIWPPPCPHAGRTRHHSGQCPTCGQPYEHVDATH